MDRSKKQMPLDGKIDLISKFANDYEGLVDCTEVPNKLTYKVASSYESASVIRSARKAAFDEIRPTGLKKFAFDTRRFDQETMRNPRTNLQNWIRSDQFIDDELQGKINIFAKMMKPLDELKQSFGNQPEWHNSYARTLYDTVYRILRVKEGDLDIFRPQIAYLEQLMYARYRLSMEEIDRIKDAEFKDVLLKKDEDLLKRGAYLHMTAAPEVGQKEMIVKDSNGNIQQNIVNAIFGNNDFRKGGERNVTRTITITINDSVND